MTIREAVTAILDDSTGETFSLWGLTDRVGLAVGWRVMPHTVRRACKLYADRAGGEFYCVDPVHGQYKYKPGVQIGGAIFD